MPEETPDPAETPPPSKVFKTNPVRVFNWEGYFAGMYVSAVRAVTGALLAFAGTQTAEAVAPIAMAHVGLTFQQASAAAISALLFDIVRYVNLKPLPDVKDSSRPPFQP